MGAQGAGRTAKCELRAPRAARHRSRAPSARASAAPPRSCGRRPVTHGAQARAARVMDADVEQAVVDGHPLHRRDLAGLVAADAHEQRPRQCTPALVRGCGSAGPHAAPGAPRSARPATCRTDCPGLRASRGRRGTCPTETALRTVIGVLAVRRHVRNRHGASHAVAERVERDVHGVDPERPREVIERAARA